MNRISTFPLELLKHIAGELPVIEDILSFSLVSRIFYDAVNSDQHVYQALFLRTYEPPATLRGYDWKTQFRRRHAKIPTEDVIIEMIREARPIRKSPVSVATSANIRALSSKFPKPGDIPRSLDSQLYPLKLIQHASMPEERRTWKDKLILSTGYQSLQTEDILIRYPQESFRIGDFFCWLLDTQMEKNDGPSFFDLHDWSRVKLEPHALPNFWEGEAKNNGLIPTRWYGGCMRWGSDFKLNDMRLTFSDKGIFSSEGIDIEPYSIHQGVVREADTDGRRHISWIKAYNSFQWAYEGMLDYGGQRMTGVWADRQNGYLVPGWGGSFGIFMYWAVPENAPTLV